MSVSQDLSQEPKPGIFGRIASLGEILLVLAAVQLGGLLMVGWLYGSIDNALPLITFGAIMIAVIAATLLLYLHKQNWAQLGLGSAAPIGRLLIRAALLAVAIIFGVYFLMTRLFDLIGLPPIDISLIEENVAGNGIAYILWMIFVVWGSAAIGEELLWRGFVINRLEKLFAGAPGKIAIVLILQAVLFGVMHSYQGMTGILLSGLTGLIFGIVYFASNRSLWMPIIAHGLVDSVAMTAAYFGVIDKLIAQ